MSDYTPPATPDGASGMSLERLRAILDAYGAAVARWPADERAAAVALLDHSDEARRAHVEAMRFDIVLDHVSAPPPSPALVRRVQRLGGTRRGVLAMISRLLPGAGGGPIFGPMVRPAAFALTAALGVAIGFALPHGTDDRSVAVTAVPTGATHGVSAGATPGEDRAGASGIAVALAPGDGAGDVVPVVSAAVTLDSLWDGALVDAPALTTGASSTQPVTETTETGTLSGIPLI